MALWGSGVRIPSAPPNSSSVRRPLFSGWAVSMQCEFGIPHSSQNKKLRSGKIPKAKSPTTNQCCLPSPRDPICLPPSPPTRHSQFQIHNSKTPLPNSLENKIEKKQSPAINHRLLNALARLLHRRRRATKPRANKPKMRAYSSGSGMTALLMVICMEPALFAAK